MDKYVYTFGNGVADGSEDTRELLGGKGANLAGMTLLGLPVPAGFTITTEACNAYLRNHGFPAGMREQVEQALASIESAMEARFGDEDSPLFLSCRSGSRASMPGMMDTVLNIGSNESTIAALARKSGSDRFAWDTFRRFIQMYGEVVSRVPLGEHQAGPFEAIIEEMKRTRGVQSDEELTFDDLRELADRFRQVIRKQTGAELPNDPREQLWSAIGAVFASWNNDRAAVYRRQYGIPQEWGTACNIQAMVFGNLGDDSGTGVALTRHPSLGSPGLFGDYLVNAQGEDVVAGIRRPKRIEESLETEMPQAYQQLKQVAERLESHFRDMQDIEFTVQRGKLWLLQTRNAKRTGLAAVRVAVDMVDEGLISPSEAIAKERIPAADIEQLLQPVFVAQAKARAVSDGRLLARGIAASPGAATGRICMHTRDAEAQVATDPSTRLILVRRSTNADDIRGMKVSAAVLTALGGPSSHAALVSRQMGRPCVVGCRSLEIDAEADTIRIGGTELRDGDRVSVDGFTGEVFAGEIETRPSEVLQWLRDGAEQRGSSVCESYRRVMQWADEFRTLQVRANADKPEQAREALLFSAEGIGLCRTEHMFFDDVDDFREMILAETAEKREAALQKMLPRQRDDFIGLFRAMGRRTITIRLLDPPLHEFLPQNREALAALAKRLGKPAMTVAARAGELEESNPMLGHRGCRVGIVYPEITRMQARAIFEAACHMKSEGIDVRPEVMVPLVFSRDELCHQERTIRAVAEEVFAQCKCRIPYKLGTMIEVPRAALVADKIASTAEFFSFGTNDLTQTTFGMSRDDSTPFLTQYQELSLLAQDPFQSIDVAGVGAIMQIAVERGRGVRPDLDIGICGEHGGNPESIRFCQQLGLDYVSCSPLRVPVARLAAAQAAIELQNES